MSDSTTRYVVMVPVEIEAADEGSRRAAKQYLKQHFSKIEAGASTETLCWSVKLGKARLTKADNG